MIKVIISINEEDENKQGIKIELDDSQEHTQNELEATSHIYEAIIDFLDSAQKEHDDRMKGEKEIDDVGDQEDNSIPA